MSYTSPSNTAVDFEFQSGYSSPTNTSVDFSFDKTTKKAKVYSTAAISQTTSAFGDLQGNTTAPQGVSTTAESATVPIIGQQLFTVDAVDSLTTTTTKRRVTLAAAADAQTVASVFEITEITDNQRAGDASFDVNFPGPSDEVDFRQRSHEVIYPDANDS